jgi:predicted PurR-regulated permease PerM
LRVTLTNRGLLRAVLLAFGLLLVYQFLAAVVATVLLLATGLLLAVALSAPVELLHRRKVPRPAAVTLIVLVILAALGLGGYLLLPVLAEQVSRLASYLPDALSQLVERLRSLAGSLGLQTGSGSISPSTLASIGRRLLGGVLGIFGGLASFLTGLVVILFVPLYLAAMPEPVERWIVRLFPIGRREKARKVLRESRESLLGWLYVIGVPGALFLGIFSGLVAFVPIIGSVVGAVPPLLLAFAGSPLDALWVLLAYVTIQQIESNLLTPLVMQRAVSLHPVVVIASVTVAGAAFGVLGALLAVPASVVAGVLVDELWFRRLEEKEASGFSE